ncbi:hypothetical protein CVT25_013098 [Psilocybe cyanescens]|uniref:Tyrosinase copper-binding domain-containing protein n=1 Tax=Psilocybe cyanescens TaxID=93625 RepID=A0A409XHP2_PSICY|nr:hypothetical protein CVT25_013098 [Psilocybe cyanescens]
MALAALATSSGYDQYGQRLCRNLRKRYEWYQFLWRTLNDTQKADYIREVRYLQTSPARNPVFQEAVTRFDEFQAYHLQQGDLIHHVGQFLPWHRYWLQLYENALRNECGYQGRNPLNKRILPPNIPLDELVFPDKWRGCIHDGSFANYTVRLGPGKQITTHCVVRQIDDTYAAYLNSKAIAELMQCPTFAIFRYQLEGMPETTNHRIHDGGHLSVGGEMSNQYSSASDRVWNWQQQNSSRLCEISGNTSFGAPPYTEVTLDFPLKMSSAIGPTIPIWQTMNIYSEYNCSTYV